MNLYWRITKIVLLGILIPGGVFAFGYLFLGPNMERMPRLDEKGWEVEVARLKALPEPEAEPIEPATHQRPKIKVSSSKSTNRRRQRPDSKTLQKGVLEPKPSEATAEVPPPDTGTLTSN